MARNGAVPAGELTYVQGSIQLDQTVASAWFRMRSAAARQGVDLTIAAPAGGYRSLAVQQDMHDRPGLYNLNPNSTIPLAPVGMSTHGFGTRVDIGTTAGNTWAIANAREFGFYREFGASDPNHYGFMTPEDDMLIITATRLSNTPTYLLTPGSAYVFVDYDDLMVFLNVHPNAVTRQTGTFGRFQDPNDVLVALFAQYGMPLTLNQIAALPRGSTYRTP